MTPVCDGIFNSDHLEQSYGPKHFEDNIGLLVLKMIVWKKTPICEWIFHLWPFGME